MSEFIDEDLVIKDIDSMLYKYLYFYRIDIKNYFVSDRQKLLQKIKSNILCIYFFICAIRYAILSIIFKTKGISLYYFDLIQFFGEFPQFYYLCAVFVSIFSFRILHIFNHNNNNDYEWLRIIKVLNGSQSLNSLKIYNKKEIKEYVQKIKFFKNIIYLCFYSQLSFDFFTAFSFLFLFFDFSNLIKFGFFSAFIYLINCYFLMSVIFFNFF
jgi:hypothetical protein